MQYYLQISQRTLRKGDVVGCALDLTVPEIRFTLNGQQVCNSSYQIRVLEVNTFIKGTLLCAWQSTQVLLESGSDSSSEKVFPSCVM